MRLCRLDIHIVTSLCACLSLTACTGSGALGSLALSSSSQNLRLWEKLVSRAHFFMEIDQPTEARHCLEEACRLVSDGGSAAERMRKVSTLVDLSNCWLHLKNNAAAKQCMDQALALEPKRQELLEATNSGLGTENDRAARARIFWSEHCRALATMGKTLSADDQHTEAQKCLRRAFDDYLPDFRETHDRIIAGSMAEIAYQLYRACDRVCAPEEYRQWLVRAYVLHRYAGMSTHALAHLQQQAEATMDKGKDGSPEATWLGSVEQTRKYLHLDEEFQTKTWSHLIDLADRHHKAGQTDLALAELADAQRECERLGVVNAPAAVTLSRLATVQADNKNWRAASDYKARAVAIQEQLLPPASLQLADEQDELGRYLYNADDFTAAIKVYLSCARIYTQSKRHDAAVNAGVAYQRAAEAAARLKHWQEVLDYCAKSEKIFRSCDQTLLATSMPAGNAWAIALGYAANAEEQRAAAESDPVKKKAMQDRFDLFAHQCLEIMGRYTKVLPWQTKDFLYMIVTPGLNAHGYTTEARRLYAESLPTAQAHPGIESAQLIHAYARFAFDERDFARARTLWLGLLQWHKQGHMPADYTQSDIYWYVARAAAGAGSLDESDHYMELFRQMSLRKPPTAENKIHLAMTDCVYKVERAFATNRLADLRAVRPDFAAALRLPGAAPMDTLILTDYSRALERQIQALEKQH